MPVGQGNAPDPFGMGVQHGLGAPVAIHGQKGRKEIGGKHDRVTGHAAAILRAQDGIGLR